jgi:hypothetical protein
MRCILLCVLILLPVSGAASATDEEQAHRRAITALDDYQDCLAEEYENVSRSKKMPEQEFVVYIGGVCIPSRESYRARILDFLTIQFPMMKQSLRIDSANDAVEHVQRDLVRAYVRGETHRD